MLSVMGLTMGLQSQDYKPIRFLIVAVFFLVGPGDFYNLSFFNFN